MALLVVAESGGFNTCLRIWRTSSIVKRPWESPTTGAGLSDISGAGGTAMTFFWLSFTVISRSPDCWAEPVIAPTAGCELGHALMAQLASGHSLQRLR
jgi:hypothetical protein